MVMGLAFLFDSFLGVDTTIICHELEIASSTKFQEEYPPYPYKSSAVPFLFLRGPRTVPLNPLAITKTPMLRTIRLFFSSLTCVCLMPSIFTCLNTSLPTGTHESLNTC
jgi:hypothetical protein